MRLPEAFRAFRSANYRLFFFGQSLSLIGTWMQQVALGWLVYRLTGSAFSLGLVGFLGQIPVFLLALLGGVLSDRFDRRKILFVSQGLAMLQALCLALLVLFGKASMGWILPLTLMLGVANALDIPTRQAFVVQMVDQPKDLGNAIALNSLTFNMARLIGPPIAGWFIASFGEGWCFLLNALSYTAVIGSLMMMRVPKSIRRARPTPLLKALQEGFSYTFSTLPLRVVMLYLALTSLVGVPFMTLAPVFAKDIFHGGPHTLGVLMAASGAGAFVGGLYLASRKSVLGLTGHIQASGLLFGFALFGYALSGTMGLALVFLIGTGFGMIVQMAASNTLLQTIVEEDKRGRVMSLYAMSFMGVIPFGSLLAGASAARFGAPTTVLMGSVGAFLGAGWFATKLPRVRASLDQLYRDKGFLGPKGKEEPA